MNNEHTVKMVADRQVRSVLPTLLPARERTLYYTGSVTKSLNDRVLRSVGKLLDESNEPIGLLVTSPGGATGCAMSFFDTIKHVLHPDLVTIGSGDVDSSGVIIFLAGTRRYVTTRTTMLLHSAGRTFGSQRYTTREMKAMLAEDRLKDLQYAGVLAEGSRGKLTRASVLSMMERGVVLTPTQMLAFGLADFVLP